MNKEKYVFAQLIGSLDKNKFRHLVDKYDRNRDVKHLGAEVDHDLAARYSYESAD